jgi:tetratricopeptide (TPR) repeat protein
MFKRMFRVLALASLMLSAAVFADTLTLTDGSTLEGKVVPQGEKYWIKDAAGQSRFIPKSQVKSWTKGSATAAPARPASPASPVSPDSPFSPAAPNTASVVKGSGGTSASQPIPNLSFAETKSRADRADAPLAAVSLWQAFIDNNENSPELPAARSELEKWKKLDADKAEKINGKWVGGEDRKKLIAKVKELLKEADAMSGKQTLQAVNKLQEAVKLYPNNWEANFELGFFYLSKGGNAQYDKAIASLESASKLRPNSAATLSNLAIAYNFRKQYEKSVLTAYKAAQLEDSKDIVQNLINSIAQAPLCRR